MKSNDFFKKQCISVHGSKYDYSKVDYKGSKKKICVICPIHGEFWQEANSHLKGCGCPECNGTKKKTTDEFIKESKDVFGDKYIYDKTDYKNNSTDVCITCKMHGDFYVRPNNHLHGSGCPECSKLKRYSNEELIEKAKKIHKDLYDYSKTYYKNARTKITVTCKKHGDFEISSTDHLQGKGCPICDNENRIKKYLEHFKNEANLKHNFKYSYENTVCNGSKEKVEIICPIHGSFFMTPNSHLQGQGCPKCGDERMANKSRLGKDKAIERFKKIYNDEYSYEEWENEYKSIEDKIPIICQKHGIFYKTVHQHLQGQGCPKCQCSAIENSIREFLNKNNIEFEEQKKFDWLKYSENGNMRLDFYLPKYNIAIECQGEQHYKPIKLFGGEETFKYQVDRDKIKLEKCKENGIKIIYFGARKYVNNVITNKKELLKEIKKYE